MTDPTPEDDRIRRLGEMAKALAERDARIAELERQVGVMYKGLFRILGAVKDVMRKCLTPRPSR